MEGFLPLIEGFLAFALTMLALTTAVSAIVGVLHRVRRRRAQGLRDMVRMLYLTEIRDLLPESYFQKLRDRESARASALLARWRPGFELKHDAAIDGRLEGRADFISDMTLMPLPAVVDGLDVDQDYWKMKLESAERLAGRPWYVKIRHPVRWIRRWRTLRYGLETLTDDEFKQRLARSDAIKSIHEVDAWSERGLESWEELEDHLLKMFQTIGSASSETFARHSRFWSVAVGFLLAFGVNVDSIDLFNSYLTDPRLRADVLAQSKDILSQKNTASVEGGKEVLTEGRKQLAEASQQLTKNAVGLLDDVKPRLASALGEEQANRLVTDLEEHLDQVAQGAADVQSGLGELDQELTKAKGQVQGTVRALTASFPVGWSRFPNCSATSPDLRCAQATTEESPLAAALQRPADFSQWFVGVLVTGLLLGLGTPFWIQVVNAVLKLRRWVTDKGDTQKSDGKTDQGNTPGTNSSPDSAGT